MSRLVYSTIMEIDQQQRRLKVEAVQREIELKIKTILEDKPVIVKEDVVPLLLLPPPEIPPMEEVRIFPPESTELVKEEKVSVIENKASLLAGAVIGSLGLLLFFFFVGSFKSSAPWVNMVIAQLNASIAHGAFYVINHLQGSSALEGYILNTHYYKISLQGDLVPFYALELLILLASFFSFFQKTNWIKEGVIFISLVPLVIVVHILRVVAAFGLALNDGAAYADRCFDGILVGGVVVFITLVLIFLEFVLAPDI